RSILLPIEQNRTCFSAGIPHNFCAFQPFLSLDPSRPADALFMRQALLLLAQRMNDLSKMFNVDDVCKPASLVLVPSIENIPKDLPQTFEDIGTEDLVVESGYASANVARASKESRVFYFMVYVRNNMHRKYSVTMIEN